MKQPSTPDDPSKRPLSEQGSSPETRRAAQVSAEDSANDALGRAGTHPLGTAIGGIGGAMAGAVAGIAAGPVGSLAGAIAGALGGAAMGSGSVTPPATGPVVEAAPTEIEELSGESVEGDDDGDPESQATRKKPRTRRTQGSGGAADQTPVQPPRRGGDA